MADSMEPCQNVVGSTFVAMATKFELSAEIQSPTGLYYDALPNGIIWYRKKHQQQG